MPDTLQIKEDIIKMKDLINKGDNLSLDETLELYRLRSYYFKMYGLTSEDIIYSSIDELVKRVEDIKEKIDKNIEIKSKKITLDDIFNSNDENIDDYRKILRKSFINKAVKIRHSGRDFKLSISNDSININIPKSCNIEQEIKDNHENDKNNEEILPEDIFSSINISENKKEEIVYVDDIPILKNTGKRYRVFKYSLDQFDNKTVKKIANKLKEIFNDKFYMYFMRIFNLSSKKDVKKILEDSEK